MTNMPRPTSTDATPIATVSGPRRRTPLVLAGVAALLLATFGATGDVGAIPYYDVVVTASASPTETTVGETVTVTGSVAAQWLTSTDTDMAGCSAGPGSVVASSCEPEVPTGSADVVIDGATAATVALDEEGSLSWATDELAVGTHEIQVDYPGDDGFAPGVSDTVTVTVNAAPTPAPGPSGAYGDSSTAMTVTQGGTVTVRGQDWLADTSVSVTLRSEPVLLGNATAGADGTFTQSYAIPAATPAGAHTITLAGTGADGQPASVVLDLTVVAAASPTARAAAAPSSLAFTG
jgi:hypothetical protein